MQGSKDLQAVAAPIAFPDFALSAAKRDLDLEFRVNRPHSTRLARQEAHRDLLPQQEPRRLPPRHQEAQPLQHHPPLQALHRHPQKRRRLYSLHLHQRQLHQLRQRPTQPRHRHPGTRQRNHTPLLEAPLPAGCPTGGHALQLEGKRQSTATLTPTSRSPAPNTGPTSKTTSSSTSRPSNSTKKRTSATISSKDNSKSTKKTLSKMSPICSGWAGLIKERRNKKIFLSSFS